MMFGQEPPAYLPKEMAVGPNIRDLTDFDIYFCVFLCCIVVASRVLQPLTTCWTLFDRGSAPHEWATRPIYISVPIMIGDLIWLNFNLS